MMRHRRWLTRLLWIVLALAMALPMKNALARNNWSLHFLRLTLSGNLDALAAISLPPPRHAGGAIWFAAQALQADQPQRVTVSWQALLVQYRENPADTLIWGSVENALGNTQAAIKLWLLGEHWSEAIGAARQAELRGDTYTAAWIFQQVYHANPQVGTEPWAEYLVRQGESPQALVVLQDSVARFPDAQRRVAWQVKIGDIYRTQQKDCEQASKIYRRVVADPQVTGYWAAAARVALGWCAYQEGQREEALGWFQNAIFVAPEIGDGYYALGRLLVFEGDIASADNWFAEALARNPHVATWWLAWADVALKSSPPALAEALRRYEIVAQRFPGWPLVYAHWARGLHLAHRDEEAAQMMQRAIALNPHPSAEDWVMLGSFLEASGEVNGAIQAYQEALHISPNISSAAAALKRLQDKP